MKNFFSSMLGSLAALFIFSFLSVFISFAILIGIATSTSKTPAVKEKSLLELRLQGEIVERMREKDALLDQLAFAGGENTIKRQGLNVILKAIENAATDDKIAGIYVRADMFSAGFAASKEIRDALLNFKKSGKILVAYADHYSQKAYYIASAADKVYLNPMGAVDLHGLSSKTMFVKNTLEKVGVEMTVIKHGKYKSAVEPFTSEKMSEESREQTERLLEEIWHVYGEEVAASRHLTPQMINKYADKVMMFQKPELTVNYKLVDALMYYDEMLDELKKLMGKSSEEDVPRILTSHYVQTLTPSTKNHEKIAVIYAEGAIDAGNSGGINSQKLAHDIRQARLDDDVKAIVLRINSPGGSAYGSEQIWREVMLAREGKPFIASMGDVAASGGYYIACAAHSIVAQPNTITGSIGIFAMFPDVSKLNDKLGLTLDGVQTHKLADFLSPNRPSTEEEKRLLQSYITRGYESFVKRCADGRHTEPEGINAVAQGRIWIGSDAKKQGLVDQLGGIKDALSLAAEMSGLENYDIVEYPAPKPLFQSLLEGFQGEMKTGLMKIRYGETYKLYQYAERIKAMQGMQARIPFDLEIY